MKLSLLDMVQLILSTSVDGDPVNSIRDTVESEQVSDVIKNTYLNLSTRYKWGYLERLFRLDPSIDEGKPTHMVMPNGLFEVSFVNYNLANANQIKQGLDLYRNVQYQFPDEFLRRQNALNSRSKNVVSVKDYSGVNLLVVNNKAPDYWTSFDEKHMVFDSYNAEVDDTLQSTKTQCFGTFAPNWESVGSFVPDMPEDCFPLLLEESKARASYLLKQAPDQLAMLESKRQAIFLSQNQRKYNRGIRYPNYGRKSWK